MAIEREYTLIVQKQKSILNDVLSISTDDDGVSIYLRLLGSSYFDINKHKYLYSKIAVCDKYKIIKENDITPIVDNRILFKINYDLTNLLTVGQYQLYIRLIDDRGQCLTLPPIRFECIKTPLTALTLSEGEIEETQIDNTSIQDLGEDIPVYLDDGSYNSTIWSTGDLITASKMNKIESALNNEIDNTIQIKDALELLNKEKGYILKESTPNEPVLICNLPKGNYIINGFIKDFETNSLVEVEDARYYVVYADDECSYVIQNLESDKIPILFKYDVVNNIKIAVKSNVEVLTTTTDVLHLTGSEYQFLDIGDLVTLKLPEGIDFTKIHLLIKPSSDLIITFPQIIWQEYPNIKANTLTEIILTYFNGYWYGNSINYAIDIYDGVISGETYIAENLAYSDYVGMITNALGEEYVLDE